MDKFLQSTRKKRRVLVVDDEMVNRELLQAVLAMDYEVSCACSGVEAMEMLRSSPQPYSLILLDLLMPHMSGFEVLEACKADEALREIPIIVMTSEKSAEVRSIHKGADDFIPKPYRMPEVILARCARIVELSEEKQLIRSLEKDPATGLYIKLFFDAYLKRLAPDVRGAWDAVVMKLDGLCDLPEESCKAVLKKLGELMPRQLVGAKGIACRDGNAVYVFCRHREDYSEALAALQGEVSACDGAQTVTLRAGICARVNKEEPVEGWFERAREACDSIEESKRGAAVVSG